MLNSLFVACNIFVSRSVLILHCTLHRSFFHGKYAQKRAYVRRVINYYETLEKKFGIV
jgi:hypothetical protein